MKKILSFILALIAVVILWPYAASVIKPRTEYYPPPTLPTTAVPVLISPTIQPQPQQPQPAPVIRDWTPELTAVTRNFDNATKLMEACALARVKAATEFPPRLVDCQPVFDNLETAKQKLAELQAAMAAEQAPAMLPQVGGVGLCFDAQISQAERQAIASGISQWGIQAVESENCTVTVHAADLEGDTLAQAELGGSQIWIDFQRVSTCTAPYAMALESVARHEYGHILGLWDSTGVMSTDSGASCITSGDY